MQFRVGKRDPRPGVHVVRTRGDGLAERRNWPPETASAAPESARARPADPGHSGLFASSCSYSARRPRPASPPGMRCPASIAAIEGLSGLVLVQLSSSASAFAGSPPHSEPPPAVALSAAFCAVRGAARLPPRLRVGVTLLRDQQMRQRRHSRRTNPARLSTAWRYSCSADLQVPAAFGNLPASSVSGGGLRRQLQRVHQRIPRTGRVRWAQQPCQYPVRLSLRRRGSADSAPAPPSPAAARSPLWCPFPVRLWAARSSPQRLARLKLLRVRRHRPCDTTLRRIRMPLRRPPHSAIGRSARVGRCADR